MWWCASSTVVCPVCGVLWHCALLLGMVCTSRQQQPAAAGAVVVCAASAPSLRYIVVIQPTLLRIACQQTNSVIPLDAQSHQAVLGPWLCRLWNLVFVRLCVHALSLQTTPSLTLCSEVTHTYNLLYRLALCLLTCTCSCTCVVHLDCFHKPLHACSFFGSMGIMDTHHAHMVV